VSFRQFLQSSTSNVVSALALSHGIEQPGLDEGFQVRGRYLHRHVCIVSVCGVVDSIPHGCINKRRCGPIGEPKVRQARLDLLPNCCEKFKKLSNESKKVLTVIVKKPVKK
jgi:hypothetical protein